MQSLRCPDGSGVAPLHSQIRGRYSNNSVFVILLKSGTLHLICLFLVFLAHSPKALPLYKLSITEKVVQAVQSMLLPQEGSLSIHTSLPATGDGSSPVMAAVRLLAEIRTRFVDEAGLFFNFFC